MSEAKTEKTGVKGKKVLVAVILVRGLIDIKEGIKDTLKMLRLFRKNYCVVIEDSASSRGMVNKVKDYTTWGEIDEPTLKLLIEKRSEKNPRDPKKTKAFFRLQPPRKGFGRNGIKYPFSKGGALGYRGEKINDLIKRML
ncbi:MAG TPA: uL30 family ribosomal protein [Candidatus Nanoarchaeia archaeon]|nr:uL30 family ribosomal protein [Candidatus Nanoarchaeia archaeon]